MGRYEMIVAVVAIVMFASVLRARYGFHRGRKSDDHSVRDARDDAETARLRDEVKMLKERLHVLERIAVEKESSLEREIERLRDR